MHLPDSSSQIRITVSRVSLVPQIAVYKDRRWQYIGGSDVFATLTIYPSATNQSDTNKSNPAVALKM